MKLLYTPGLVEELGHHEVIIDACSLIDASKNPVIEDIYRDIGDHGGELFTVTPAMVEVLYGASTNDERKRLRGFLASINIKCFSEIQERFFSPEGAMFQLVLRNCKTKNPSYVDMLLMFAACLEKDARLLTSNYKDIPREIFDLEDMIVFGNGCDDLHPIGIYKLNQHRFKEKVDKLS